MKLLLCGIGFVLMLFVLSKVLFVLFYFFGGVLLVGVFLWILWMVWRCWLYR